MAVPVRSHLFAQIVDNHERLISSTNRMMISKRNVLDTQCAKMGKPQQILDYKIQNVDFLGSNLDNHLRHLISQKQNRLVKIISVIKTPAEKIKNLSQSLAHYDQMLKKDLCQILKNKKSSLDTLSRILESLSFERVLDRGYAVIRNSQGAIIGQSQSIQHNEEIEILFKDNDRLTSIAKKH